MDGLSRLRAIIDGTLTPPPINAVANLRFLEAEPGRFVLSAQPAGCHLNLGGTVHGGWAATVLDTGLGCSVLTSLSAQESFTTIEFKLNLMKAIPNDGTVLRCVGTLLRRGRSIAVSTAELFDGAGASLAYAVGTCMIMPSVPPAPAAG